MFSFNWWEILIIKNVKKNIEHKQTGNINLYKSHDKLSVSGLEYKISICYSWDLRVKSKSKSAELGVDSLDKDVLDIQYIII